jgi:hypothetical protein
MKKVKNNLAEPEVGKSLNLTKQHSRFSPVAKKCKSRYLFRFTDTIFEVSFGLNDTQERQLLLVYI